MNTAVLADQATRDIDVVGGGRVRLCGDKLIVFEAVEHLCRKRADATCHEVLEVVAAWLGRPAPMHVYSGRLSELGKLGAIEAAPEKRDDVQTIRTRAARGRASRVTAWRLPVLQRVLPLGASGDIEAQRSRTNET